MAIEFPVLRVLALIPDDLPLAVRSQIARTLTSTVMVYHRKGLIPNVSRFATALVARRLHAARQAAKGDTSGWSRVVASDERDRARVASVAYGTEPLAVDVLAATLGGDMLLKDDGWVSTHSNIDADAYVDPQVAGWTSLLLGHEIGCDDASCTTCYLASTRRWHLLLKHLGSIGVTPRLVLDYYASLRAGGWMSTLLVRSQEDAEPPSGHRGHEAEGSVESDDYRF